MNSYSAIITKISYLVFFTIYVGIGVLVGEAELDVIGSSIFLASALFLVLVFAVSCISERFYWISFFVVILFTPNLINEVFPEVPMGPDYMNPHFSVITHIDLFFLLGFLLYADLKRKIEIVSVFPVLLIGFLFVFFFVTSYLTDRLDTFLFASFQLRYLFAIALLCVFTNALDHKYELGLSFILACCFVVLESFVFTQLGDYQRLTSGNYGVNGLGHLMAAAIVAVCFNSRINLFFKFILFILFFSTLIFSGTRFSLIVLIVTFCAVFLLNKRRVSWFVVSCVGLFLSLYVFFFVTPLGNDLLAGLSRVFDSWKDPLGIINTSESSSMRTRLIMWWGTVDMIFDNWLLGVGPGVWTYMKSDYMIPFPTLLDVHNDFLLYLSMYGLVFGLLFYLFVFIFPLFKSFISYKYRNKLFFLIVVIAFFVAGLTNSVTWKHQLAALVYFSSYMLFVNTKDYGNREKS